MANFCVYCERKRPPEPVRMIVLGPPDDMQWIECCNTCFVGGSGEFTNAETGQKVTFAQLWAVLNPDTGGSGIDLDKLD
jgi:hypothetical protein